MVLLATHDPRIGEAVRDARTVDIADGAIAPHDG
jgi:hypothetical protein